MKQDSIGPVVTLWNALQCELDSPEAADDDQAPCAITMKTAIIYIPHPDEKAMCKLVSCGWAPKKQTRWTSVWSVKDGVFQPLGGKWLLSTKGIAVPCELA